MAHPALGRHLSRHEMAVAAPVVHFTFGAGASTAYGIVAERAPWATAGAGTAFGTVLWAAADEAVVPLLGLSHPRRIRPADHLQAFTAHLVFGFTAELVRRSVRRALP